MENTLRLRCDLTQAVANKMNEFSSKYPYMLFFGSMTEDNIDTLMYFSEMKLTANKEDLIVTAKLEKDFFDTFTEDEIKQVKETALEIQKRDLMEQMSGMDKILKNESESESEFNFKFELDKDTEKKLSDLLEKEVKKQFKFRKVTEEELNVVKVIQGKLKEHGLNMELLNTNMGFGLQYFAETMILTGRQLRILINLLHKMFDFISFRRVKVENKYQVLLTIGKSLEVVDI